MTWELLARARSLWRGVRGGDAVEGDMREEFRLHQELRAAELMRQGLDHAAAARQARLEFGSTEHYVVRGRASRGLRPFDDLRVSWLDFKLGIRMLLRYPGLTLVGGVAIAFATAVGAGTFEVIRQMVITSIPLPHGDRIVALQNWDVRRSAVEDRVLGDLALWRERLRSFEEIGAQRTVQRNLLIADGEGGEPIVTAEMTASAFRIARVPALLGRALIEADEGPAAAPVAVIGHRLWQRRFDGDSGIVGRAVRLGGVQHTIVGVMPQGYAFPAFHEAWTALRLRPHDYQPGQGPPVTRVFGRLRDGVSRAEAQAEFASLGARAARDFPATHATVRAQVVPYAQAVMEIGRLESLTLLSLNVFFALLVALVYGNVALLMFARAASREGEIVVRTALGAGRGRIIAQLLAEALVLGILGASAGLLLARTLLRLTVDSFAVGEPIPFWFRGTLEPSTIAYATALTLLGAVFAGVLPALKVTRGVGERLRQSTDGAGGLRFGGIWTGVIVAQVAVTVAFPVAAFFERRDGVQLQRYSAGISEREFLTTRLETDDEALRVSGDTTLAARAGRVAATRRELERRVAAEPGVVGVTFAERVPKMWYPRVRVDIENRRASPADSSGDHLVSHAAAADDYLATLGATMLAGRDFTPGDVVNGARVAIVNATFVREVLGGRNAVGERLRWAAPRRGDAADQVGTGEWYEIVGVAPDLGMTNGGDPSVSGAGFYTPLSPGSAADAVHMVVRMRGDARRFAPRLLQLAAAVDPSLRLYDTLTVDALADEELRTIAYFFRIIVAVSAMALLLSLAGIYSVMSFTVSRRTREIGIRVALGSDRRRVVASVFARPLRQVGLGVALGGVIAAVLVFGIYGRNTSAGQLLMVTAYGALMLVVCLLACVLPTRRALSVEPTEALRSE